MANKGGFSWKRATGVTKAKQKIARATGVPTTKYGRKRKAEHMVASGCLTYVAISIFIITAIVLIIL